MSLNEQTLVSLREQIRAGDITPVDVARDVAAAVDAQNDEFNAYLTFDAGAIMDEAQRVTDAGDYKSQPLAGLPIALKDNIVVEGGKTTCGSRILEGFVSPYDATVVKKLRSAGAVIAGKTNLDEFAMGSSTENSAFGPSKNPWNKEHAPGGSSGGSAVAVAADLAVASLGSDTGGSIRQPASFSGVVGMKPTYGRVSRYGLVAFASSLDQIGPFSKCVADSAAVLNAICGRDPQDSTSVDAEVSDFEAGLEHGFEGLTFGVPRDFLGVGMNDDVRANFDSVIEGLEREGAKVVDISLPNAQHAVGTYYIIANAEASSNLARYDGVKYGFRAPGDHDVLSMYTHTRDRGFGDEVKRRVLLGTYVLSAGYYDAYYLKAQKIRSLMINDFAAAHEACDLIVLPTAPSTAFKFGEKADPLQMYLSDIFTIPVNLAGLPGVSLPTGLSADGLPFGTQLVGKPLAEATVLQGAAAIERMVKFERRHDG